MDFSNLLKQYYRFWFTRAFYHTA